MRTSGRRLPGFWLIPVLAILPFWAQTHGKDKTEFFQGKEAAANEVLVKFRPSTFQSVLQAQTAEEIDESEWVGGSGLLRLHSSRKNVATLVGELSARSDVEYAEPNYIVHTTAIPNDPRFGELWGLQNTGDRKSTRLNSSHLVISYAVFCLKKKKTTPVTRARSTVQLR